MDKIILVTGLGDRKAMIPLLSWWWRVWSWEMINFDTKWKSAETYEDKLKRLLTLIDDSKAIILVGTSAGGSLVMNVFDKRKNKIKKQINICGRLRVGKLNNQNKLINRAKGYPAFYDSVIMAEKIINKLTPRDKLKILTVTPKWTDEIVPKETVKIDGVENIVLPTAGHVFSILIGLIILPIQIKK